MSENKKIVVLSTVDSEEKALELARELVGRRAAACVNLVGGVRSVYRWRGKVHDEGEILLLIKTRSDRFATVAEIIEDVSGYDCPEAIALTVAEGSESYLDWLDSCLEGVDGW